MTINFVRLTELWSHTKMAIVLREAYSWMHKRNETRAGIYCKILKKKEKPVKEAPEENSQ